MSVFDDYTKLLDEIAETYDRMKSLQTEIAFACKTEAEAKRKRINALEYVMKRLTKMLKDRGDPRV